jgi:ketosteroid isomerase-like protein
MPTVRGRTAFDAFLQRAFRGRRVIDVSVSIDEIIASGDLGYLIATYSQAFKLDAGGVEDARGRFIFVWRRETDGSWKIARAVEADAGP